MKRNKFFSKRRLASFVALVLSVNTLSVTAWAGNFGDLQYIIDNAPDVEGVRNVTLTEDYTYGDPSSREGGQADGNNKTIMINNGMNVNLNLNGWTITGVGSSDPQGGSVITVEGANSKLTLSDTQADGFQADGDGNKVEGTITNGAAKNGGGVRVTHKAEFIMNGGTITGNRSQNTSYTGGAGVYVYDAKFTMNGGKITGNTAVNDAAGVELDNGAVFVMNGGEITGNTAGRDGGGVNVKRNNATFEMNGGAIYGNVASHEGSDIYGEPSKVTINAGTVTEDVQKTYAPNAPYVTNVEGEEGIVTIHATHKVVDVKGKAPTCTETGLTAGKYCSVCNTVLVAQETTPAKGHTEVIDAAKAPTCTETGLTAGKHCSVCNTKLVEQETVAAKGHTEETIPGKAPTATETGLTDGIKCSVCGKIIKPQEIIPATGEPQPPVDGDNTDTPENPDDGDTETPTEPTPEEPAPETPETPEEPETPDTGDTGTTEPETPAEGGTVIPDDETPLAADPTAAPAADADTTVITDEPIPLAGLITRAQLLAELYRYEQRPEVVLPEEFDFAEHEYALAICWGLDNALETHTEDDPYLPDDLLTVGVLREVLVNFVAYKGIEDLEFTVEGEDDELVMDLDVRLAAFYELLEAAEA